jgi:O-antigen ligase
MFFFLFAAFLLLAPLYKAGNRPVPLLLLELAAIGILFVLLAVYRSPAVPSGAMRVAIALLLVYPLVQLVPLPDALWRTLPGHEPYAMVLDRFAAPGGVGQWRAISIIPTATEYGWLALLPPLACLLAVLRLSTDQVARLLLLMAVFAGAESLLGLLQVAPGGGGLLYLGNEEPGQNVAIGTFVNRNHLAAMLAMVLPVIVGLIVHGLRPGLRRVKRPAKAAASEAVAQRVLLFAAAVMILVCLVFTKSRAGIASGLIGLACAAVVLVRARAASVGTSSMRNASHIVTALVVIATLIALTIGIGPVLSGLAAGQLQGSADFRAAIYVATVNAAIEFLPFGSGLSTFAGIFPRFQIGDAGGYIDYAHNDYLQAFMELGLVAPVVVGLLLAAYALRMRVLLRAEGGRSFTLLQIGAGLGMLPMILHSLFDFALHMPANAMWFATLAGVIFHRMVSPREPFRGHRPKLTAHGLEGATTPPFALPEIELPPLPERIEQPDVVPLPGRQNRFGR